ncbi:MAG: hemerythrin domain-containing protein [Sideroxyarcus sp.]|nr:hemerythrin domain-containing protein [Sideroxyarcus sp.]
MLPKKIFRGVRPYLTAAAVVVVVGLLVFAIYFTELGMQWITFLTGILIASILGMASRASRAEWIITRRTAQLTSIKDRLEQETQFRKKATADHQQALSLLQQTEQAFGRLIPHQLLKLLERNSILDVKLGDQIERKLTIMFTDIRSFTALSETMTPQENFNFLNSYLKQMEPIIGMHHGIIDKYVGDTILALFTQGADDAVSGAIHMLEKLEEYNTGRARAGYAPVRIGFGLNTGLVMIGTVGGENRMESTVIGDAVNLTSRIEESTKIYNTPLLISQNTLYDLAIPGKYDIRFLDRIRVKGKTQPLSIYEVFNNDPIKLRDGKRTTKVKFEKAIIYYHLKEIPRAMELLTQCIETTPKDLPARIYLARCESFLASGRHVSTGELNNHLEWKDEFQIGIENIDASHKLLFDKINEFISASISGDSQGIREIFSHLGNHYIESVGEEENLMRRYNYPFLETHLQEHKRFIENFIALKEEIYAENCDLPFLSFRIQLLLFDWFTGHIAKSDRHAGRYLLNARQAPASVA